MWHQRQRAAQLLDVARKYPDFPVVLETVRECLQDVYDVPTLTDLMADIARRFAGAVDTLIATGNTTANRARLAVLVQERESSGHFGEPALDETLEAIRDEMRKFALAEVIPFAHEWHLNNQYIPLDVIAKLSELGVFGLTLPESFGGMVSPPRNRRRRLRRSRRRRSSQPVPAPVHARLAVAPGTP